MKNAYEKGMGLTQKHVIAMHVVRSRDISTDNQSVMRISPLASPGQNVPGQSSCKTLIFPDDMAVSILIGDGAALGLV